MHGRGAGSGSRIVLVALVALVVAGLGAPAAGPAAAAAPAAPAGTGCAPVTLFAVPGSGETHAGADPAVATGLLAGLTDPVARRAGARLSVSYLPYPASIDRPVAYPVSELRGVEGLGAAVVGAARRCPRTLLALVGYSQGADVVSDLVHRVAGGTVELSPERIAGAVMLGSPRRDPDAPNLVAVPGRGILGPRPTRELAVYRGRVYEVCAPGDPICATESLDLSVLRSGLGSGAHRAYPTLPVGPAGAPLYDVLGTALGALVAAAPADGRAAG